jgi:hypothetical protein
MVLRRKILTEFLKSLSLSNDDISSCGDLLKAKPVVYVSPILYFVFGMAAGLLLAVLLCCVFFFI